MDQKPDHPTIHICDLNGHRFSVDCWCEPATIQWYRNQNGVDVLVVEHNDYTTKHRDEVLAERRAGTQEHAWIDRAITSCFPKLLPPHEDKEKS